MTFQEHIAWGFPKDSPYVALISFELNRMKESGLVKKLFQKQVNFFADCKILIKNMSENKFSLQIEPHTYTYSWSQKHYSLAKMRLCFNPFPMKIFWLHF